MIKSKKQMFIVIGVFTLVMLLGTVTYAFFNYTRTGAANTINVGRISFVSRQTQTISLTNLFPIDPSETGVMDNDTKVGTLEIEIEGDTDYAQGVEYLISATDANIYTSTGQVIPITLDFTVTGLGTPNANYFTERENKNANIYKKLVGDTLVGDGMLLVGYIKPNTTSGQIEGVNGTITIKAYLDQNKILISDTYDGKESDEMGTPNSVAEGRTVITTNEWNAREMSFKVKVEANEGIWVVGSLEEIMKKSAVMDNVNSTYVNNQTPGINFGATASNTNGKGVYIRAGTENDAYPVMYYRGDIKDNNILFANKCWKAVRTTDAGGVKLIYNGEQTYNRRIIEQSEYGSVVSNDGYTYNTADNSWNASLESDDSELDLSFHLPVGNYAMEISGTITAPEDSYAWANLEAYINDDLITGGYGDLWENRRILYATETFEVTNSNDVIKYDLYGEYNTSTYPANLSIKIYKIDEELGVGCDNVGMKAGINETSRQYNINSDSPAYSGYMYGELYTYGTSNWTSGARFGTSFTWDGTNYTLVDDDTTTPNATHHYSCNVATAGGTCNNIRYVYVLSNNVKPYITLTNGDGIEEAFIKMHTNTNNSNIKNKIETWYSNNLTSYTNKIEDTIYCNDRTIYQFNGTGSNIMTYTSMNRLFLTFNPIINCQEKNDSFTWKNAQGNQKSSYPIGMLTIDELMLTGSGGYGTNKDIYLNDGFGFWTMTPSRFMYNSYYNSFREYINVSEGNGLINGLISTNLYNIRPAITLKPGQLIISGTGTVTDPYVID